MIGLNTFSLKVSGALRAVYPMDLVTFIRKVSSSSYILPADKNDVIKLMFR